MLNNKVLKSMNYSYVKNGKSGIKKFDTFCANDYWQSVNEIKERLTNNIHYPVIYYIDL